jgi:hypothetical protein
LLLKHQVLQCHIPLILLLQSWQGAERPCWFDCHPQEALLLVLLLLLLLLIVVMALPQPQPLLPLLLLGGASVVLQLQLPSLAADLLAASQARQSGQERRIPGFPGAAMHQRMVHHQKVNAAEGHVAAQHLWLLAQQASLV